MTSSSLFSPLKVGPYELKHRVVMAPLTRMRAARPSLAPRPMNAEYYAQRATEGGLLIAEASPVVATGFGNPGVPGIYSEAQIAGWREVVDAVHAKGGLIFLQLWHVGRVSHSSFQPDGALPVAPSAVAIPAEFKCMTADGKVVEYETPRALETAEVALMVEAYRQGAKNALAAGFDGVEIHGANGYLIEQFLQSKSNVRTDQYGGSIENRARLLFEVLDAVSDVWPADRIGVRLSPFSSVGDVADSDPMSLYTHVIKQLAARQIGFLHLIEARVRAGLVDQTDDAAPQSVATLLRPLFPGPFIVSGGFTAETAEEALAAGTADLVAFGRAFIANPDLPRRLALGAPLNAPDRSTFYGGAERGYTDYPSLDEVGAFSA
ncbi:MAG TPA: alkene reductase [Bradyrhizobium sp.]|nr:alkene reductase [Bradyrhizobium sp.]